MPAARDGWLQQNGAGCVGKQNGAAAIGEVDAPRQDVRRHHQNRRIVGLDEGIGEGERIEEARARPRHVDRAGCRQTEFMRQERRGWRQQMIGCRGGEDGQRNGRAIDAALRQRHLTCFGRDVGQRFVGIGPAARADAGSRLDPTGVEAEPRLDLGIRHAARRRVMPEANDLRAHVGHSFQCVTPGR